MNTVEYVKLNNMGLINFDKPKKLSTTDEHNRKYSSDSGVEGTYVPNMSLHDNENVWKGKHIQKGKDERIEIRKAMKFSGKTMHTYANVVIIVRPIPSIEYPEVLISCNSKLGMCEDMYYEFINVIEEAKQILRK